MASQVLRVGQIGLGHWGPNLLRCLLDHPRVEVRAVCDREPAKLAKLGSFPGQRGTDASALLARDNGLDAIVIATPASTHFELAAAALRAGKHVLVEKPLTESLATSQALHDLARDCQRLLMVGHIFVYNSGVRYMRQLLQSGDLGPVHYIHSQRTNLGPIRQDADAIWDLGAHDIAIFNYLLDARPLAISAHGSLIVGQRQADVVSAVMRYPGNCTCQLLVSWLHPNKVRQITVVGERKMVVWDDMSLTEPIRIYDKSVVSKEPGEQRSGTLAEFQYAIHEGSVLIPKLTLRQPLAEECDAFVRGVLDGTAIPSDSQAGLDVVRVLDMAQQSMAQESRLLPIHFG